MAYQNDQITATIIQCIIKVHKTLGPGFLENLYRKAMLLELKHQNLYVEMEKEVVIYYEGQEVGRHRMDIVVENRVVVELKTVEALSGAHYAQVRAYMKATTVPVAILVNFSREKADFRRLEADKMKIK
jgi:GxxExxY protein